ncbi:MAG: hypothetical protein ACYTE8_03435 [Planctomycetota bacterium]|jgi:hypothetical protein
MVKNEFCKGCIQRNDCKQIYEQLGKSEGPSVAWKATAAFLLPMLVFIGSLVFFDWLLAERIGPSWLKTLVGFVFSLVVTFIGILIIKLTVKPKEIN